MGVTMSFSNVINQYIEQIHCSSKELSEASGLSETSISRYRSGERIPDATGKQMMDLVKGLSSLAKKKKIAGFEEEVLLHKLQELIPTVDIEYNKVIDHLNLLLDLFKVKSS
ncbi:MAG: helix-turn-helix transcriptional regulator, partial [Clostridiales bacterium]|nr:helix-turn-helix transcriptional regulator [Clostridiales bacterium]